MRSKTFLILGDPIPLSRARVGFGARRIWDSQKQLKLVTGIDLARQMGNLPLFEGALHIDIIFYMKIPKSLQLRQKLHKHHCYKPDIDNLIKMILDIMSNDVIFHDDCIVSYVSAQKIYDDKPRTKITVKEINESE